MDYKVIWTEEALTDIESIAQYIEKDSFVYVLAVVHAKRLLYPDFKPRFKKNS